MSGPETTPDLPDLVRRLRDELRLLLAGDDCDHSVGVCYCPAYRALDEADEFLGNRPTEAP